MNHSRSWFEFIFTVDKTRQFDESHTGLELHDGGKVMTELSSEVFLKHGLKLSLGQSLRSVFFVGPGWGKSYLLLVENNSVDDCGVVVPLGDALNPNLLSLPPSLPLDSRLKFLWKKRNCSDLNWLKVERKEWGNLVRSGRRCKQKSLSY